MVSYYTEFISVLVMILTSHVCEGQGDIEDLLSWIKSQGGSVNPNLSISCEGDEKNSFFGLRDIFIAVDDIEEDEILFLIPLETIISGYNKEAEEENACNTIENLIQEVDLAQESRFSPFINYLIKHNNDPTPDTWTEGGKSFLLEAIDETLYPANILNNSRYNLSVFECDDITKEKHYHLANQIYSQFYQFWDDEMSIIPLIHLIRHNEDLEAVNVKLTFELEEESDFFVVRADRDIEAGEELTSCVKCCTFQTHTEATDKGLDPEGCTYGGTTEIFRDYGLVEQLTQHWIADTYGIAVRLMNDKKDKDDRMEYLSFNIAPERSNFLALQYELKRLEKIMETEYNEAQRKYYQLQMQEWTTSRKFIEAYITFLKEILEKTNECMDTEYLYDLFQSDCRDEKDLVDLTVDGLHDVDNHQIIESPQSPHQKMLVLRDPETKDTCFELDGNYQTCESYRPYYHDVYFHYIARLITHDIKRVLFVGSGDGMLLHDIMQYPSIELVIALEIDQTVTRQCFKYFGTQPYYDDERVQWWYGDAAQTIKMLPEDYFGTFDIVLIGLSETEISETAIIDLDTFSLLLKPDGIFVKNELYYTEMEEMFKYSVQLYYSEVPITSDQGFTIGSNSIDFLHVDPHDHGVLDKVVWPKYVTPFSYDPWYKYVINENYTGSCSKDIDAENNVLIGRELSEMRRRGILMVLEVEDVDEDLLTKEEIEKVIIDVLEDGPFNVVDVASHLLEHEDSFVLVATMTEGYIVARGWPKSHSSYCAFDIHLWSELKEHEEVKASLLEKLGSEDSSTSFRFLVGGMFGLKAFAEDIENQGPRYTQPCDKEKKKKYNKHPFSLHDSQLANGILSKSFELFTSQENSIHVVVVCGFENEKCVTSESLKQTKRKGIVFTEIRTCSNLKNCIEGDNICMDECKSLVTSQLKLSIEQKEKKISIIIFDSSIQLKIGSVMHNTFIEKRMANSMLIDGNSLVITLTTEENKEWNQVMLDRYRTDVFRHEPTYYVDVAISGAKPNLENISLGLTSSGDTLFLNKLRNWVKFKSYPITAEILSIEGGQPIFHNPSDSTYSTSKDYSLLSAIGQWKSQQQVGQQMIVQYEVFFSSKEMTRSDAMIKKHRISEEDIEKVLESIVKKEKLENAIIEDDIKIGMGSVHQMFWEWGNIVVVWDGNFHVDLNIFTTIQTESSVEYFHVSVQSLIEFEIPQLKRVTYENHPRGRGSIVNFRRDTEAYQPLWTQ